jgi:hypothetical protein
MEQFIRSAMVVSSWTLALATLQRDLVLLLQPHLRGLVQEIFRFLMQRPSPPRILNSKESCSSVCGTWVET